MKKRIYYLLSLLTAAFLAGCQDEFRLPEMEKEIVPGTVQVAPEDLAMARDWFDTHEGAALYTRSGKEHPLYEAMIPDWTDCFTGQGKYCRTVEVGLGILKRKRMVMEECNQAWLETGDYRYLQVLTRLVVRIDLKTKEARGFLMTIVPSRQYLERTGFRPFPGNTYTHRDGHFDGWIIFHELDGSFINGWVYEDGYIAYAMEKGGGLLTRSLVATCASVYIEDCIDYFYSVNGGDWIYNGTRCDDPRYAGEECWDYHDVDDGPQGGGGDGGGVRPERPEEDPVNTPNLIPIYGKNSTLTPTQKGKLEVALVEFINKSPVYKALYDMLAQKFTKIAFHINAKIIDEGLAGYDAKTEAISFKNTNCIEEVYLEEELIHAFQHMVLYKDDIYAWRKNVEFEAKVFRDMVNMKEDIWGEKFGTYAAEEEFRNAYESWLPKCIDGFTFVQQNFNSLCNEWTGYGGNYSSSFVPEVIRDYFYNH